FRGVHPPDQHREPWRGLKKHEDRATPGGYGGKPPGVAIIGVPTGARNAGRCSDGGPEHHHECYTETPPCASRPDYEHISNPQAGRGVAVAPYAPPPALTVAGRSAGAGGCIVWPRWGGGVSGGLLVRAGVAGRQVWLIRAEPSQTCGLAPA